MGYPDAELGERTCLCVVPKEGFDGSASELRLYAKGRLEKCKIPDVVMKVEALPRLVSGKTDKAALREKVVKALDAGKRLQAHEGEVTR